MRLGWVKGEREEGGRRKEEGGGKQEAGGGRREEGGGRREVGGGRDCSWNLLSPICSCFFLWRAFRPSSTWLMRLGWVKGRGGEGGRGKGEEGGKVGGRRRREERGGRMEEGGTGRRREEGHTPCDPCHGYYRR
jgi:hypothetical protein